MIDIDKDSNNIADYTFNMLGNRVKKVTNTDTIKMLYDGYDCVADYNDADNLLRHYITPGLDENVLVYDVDNSEEYFYIHDGLGTVRQILDDTQNVENQYDYEGFGTSLGSTESIYNRFRYTGREYDKETESDPTAGGGAGTNDGLYYYRARTYDSTIGSFTSRDPIPYANLYPYCAANPIIFIDPSGNSFYFGSQFKSWNRNGSPNDIASILGKKTDKEVGYDISEEKTDENGFEPESSFYKGKTKGFGISDSDYHSDESKKDAIKALGSVGKGDIWWWEGHYNVDDHGFETGDDERMKSADFSKAYGGKGGIIILQTCHSNKVKNSFKGADILIYFTGICESNVQNELTTYFMGALLAGKTFSEAKQEALKLDKQIRLNRDGNGEDTGTNLSDVVCKDCRMFIDIADKSYKVYDEDYSTRSKKKLKDMTLREYTTLADDFVDPNDSE